MPKPIGVRHSSIKALIFALANTPFESEHLKGFLKLFKKAAESYGVPANIVKEIVEGIEDTLITKGSLPQSILARRKAGKSSKSKRSPSTPPVEAISDPTELNEEVPVDTGTPSEPAEGDIGLNPQGTESREGSDDPSSDPDLDAILEFVEDIGLDSPLGVKVETPIMLRLKQEHEALVKSSTEKMDMRVAFKPIKVDGQLYHIFSTWKLIGDGFQWNFNGTTGNNKILMRCGPDVLVFDGERAINYKDDVEFEVNVTNKDSALRGNKLKVTGSLFLWLLRYVPGRELRCWLHEDVYNPKSSKDISSVRLTIGSRPRS